MNTSAGVDVEDDHFKPFKRSDAYGDWGAAKISGTAKLRLTVLAMILFPIRAIAVFACVFSFYVVCRLDFLVPLNFRTRWIAFWGKLACRLCLFSLGFFRVRWIAIDGNEKSSGGPYSIVSNHLSWADILIHMNRSFPSFVARSGTERLPLIGIISQKMQCIYVQRENKTAETKGVSTLVKDRMGAYGTHNANTTRPMLLFPEGTTTNNSYLLPFKTGAFLAGVPLQPVLIHYEKGNISPCWESIPAKDHVFLMMCEPAHRVTCYQLPVYVPTAEEKSDPVLYANNVRDYMLRAGRELFGLHACDSNLEWKRKYHELVKQKISKT